ncbi:GGDEF domain-containing protein [Agaribacterium sp. ZY112]|uniref:GGDEF domain-containing protein n=1 Tax=Agaribacterium sp. ZY112 TaxID=3233574 RepID=UPI003523554E
MVTLASKNRRIEPSSNGAEAIGKLQLDISTRLHSSLESEDVLRNFFHALSKLMSCDGLHYRDTEHEIDIQIGHHKSHSALYRLKKEESNMGELRFSRRHRFAEAELITIESLIGLLVTPLHNARLYHAAIQGSHVDSLTGLRNRRALENCMQREIPLAHRHNNPLSILVLDIDLFKEINDTHGHLIGDECLQHIAKILKNALRAGDQAFRYGGEEFVIQLSECDSSNAYYCAERIRSQIAATPLTTTSKRIELSCSIGCATLKASDNFESLFNRADQAMYEAKRQGRNRCAQEAEKNTQDNKKIA